MNTNAKETIRQKLSIESVVGSYVKLEKAGKNFRACCPFHHEKTPSFYVTVDKGIYYCYGCHKFGDIFKFVEEIEGVSFIDALKMLAEKAGVPLDEYSGEKPSKLPLLREIVDTAAKFYEVGLRTHPEVVAYLISRGMTKETMIEFRVGYAPRGWSGLYDTLKKKKYSDEDIIATGLCIKGPKGTYDRFRERIMFPISDAQGRVIAFTGRVMPGTEEASRPVGKYINSPETDLYHKSSVLFGYDKAKSAIHAENFVIIVEGQMDLIMSHQAGVKNAVALSGTASTDEHMIQIGRFTNNIVICLDADKAGLVAAQKTAMVAYRHDMKVLVIDVPNGKDPADLILESPEAWKEAARHRKDFVTFRLEKMKQNGETDDKVAIAEKELFPVLAHIQSQIVLDDKMQEIAHAFGSSTAAPIRTEFEKFLKNHPPESLSTVSGLQAETPLPRPSTVMPEKEDPKVYLEERVIGILLALMGPDGSEGQGSPEDRQAIAVLRERFEKNIGSFQERIAALPGDLRASYVFQTEQLLGILPDAIAAYLRTCNDLLIRHEILAIEHEKAELDRKILHDPDNVEILQRAHALLMRKDTLIRTLVNQ